MEPLLLISFINNIRLCSDPSMHCLEEPMKLAKHEKMRSPKYEAAILTST